MRGTELLDKMELIDPAYVEAAAKPPERKKRRWIRWAAAAACLCLVLAGAAVAARHSAPQQSDPTALEPVTIPDLVSDGMGFEGYLCYNVSDLDNGNPWSENESLTALPVYRNGSYDPSGAGVPTGLSEDEMMKRLSFAASALHLDVRSTQVMTSGQPEGAPTEIQAETGNDTLTVQADGEIAYFLPEEGLALPDGYRFTYSRTTDEDAEQVLSYLTDAYKDLLGFAEPKAVSWGDYTINGEFNRRYQVYDAAGDDVEDILNYNFRYASFYPNDDGALYGIRISDGLLTAELLGEYPVISVEEATARLAAGQYQTNVPAAFPGEEAIGKVELVYRTGCLEEVLLPYYRFYVLLPDALNLSAGEHGLQMYGAYYVPAIGADYIANMPTYDG